MTQFEDYWARLVRKTPQLADDDTTMRISVKSLRAQLAKAHHVGFSCGMKTSQQLERLGGSEEPSDFTDLFGMLRKGKKK